MRDLNPPPYFSHHQSAVAVYAVSLGAPICPANILRCSRHRQQHAASIYATPAKMFSCWQSLPGFHSLTPLWLPLPVDLPQVWPAPDSLVHPIFSEECIGHYVAPDICLPGHLPLPGIIADISPVPDPNRIIALNPTVPHLMSDSNPNQRGRYRSRVHYKVPDAPVAAMCCGG